ncbi:hypothetical protein BOS5A_201037 [Bosea sp. EC-HK365B]|nr:hypothetical protein BOSE7B_40227 [Bosea sp. 7B]VVT59170.1 hypothetical protein BOS5A_201037 [Bosea sp. EC-HK365B]VXC75177.1 hypothetical protein BOSE127_40402 [Bosea sp. 127]
MLRARRAPLPRTDQPMSAWRSRINVRKWRFGEGTPMKRPGQPNEVAPSFLFLACQDSSYMTGEVLHPNGGTPVNG